MVVPAAAVLLLCPVVSTTVGDTEVNGSGAAEGSPAGDPAAAAAAGPHATLAGTKVLLTDDMG